VCGSVGIQRGERAQRLLALERLVAVDGVDRRVGEREGDVGVAVGHQQQVVDRRGSRLGRRRRVGQRVGEHVGEPAAGDRDGDEPRRPADGYSSHAAVRAPPREERN